MHHLTTIRGERIQSRHVFPFCFFNRHLAVSTLIRLQAGKACIEALTVEGKRRALHLHRDPFTPSIART